MTVRIVRVCLGDITPCPPSSCEKGSEEGNREEKPKLGKCTQRLLSNHLQLHVSYPISSSPHTFSPPLPDHILVEKLFSPMLMLVIEVNREILFLKNFPF